MWDRGRTNGGVLLFFIGALLLAAVAWAKDPPKTPASASMDAKQAAEKRALEVLEGTQWALELLPMSSSEPSRRPTKDTIRFEKRRVASEKLSASGFPSTNWTLTVQDNGVTVWETMQTAPDNSVAFWRGEVQGETMRGVLSRHSAKGAVEDWSFSGKKTETVAVESLNAPAQAPPAARGEGQSTTSKGSHKKGS